MRYHQIRKETACHILWFLVGRGRRQKKSFNVHLKIKSYKPGGGHSCKQNTHNRFLQNTCTAHGEVYSIQHYVIKFVSDLRGVCGFLRVLLFPTSINWSSRYFWNVVESGVKPLTLTLSTCIVDIAFIYDVILKQQWRMTFLDVHISLL